MAVQAFGLRKKKARGGVESWDGLVMVFDEGLSFRIHPYKKPV